MVLAAVDSWREFRMVWCDDGFAARCFLGGDGWVGHLFDLLPDGAGGGGEVWSA
jgi:hypothetical protein